jgi:acetyl esterase/lipase
MPSRRAQVLSRLVRRLLKPRLQPHVPLWQQRAAVRAWAAFGLLPRGTRRERLALAGIAAERLSPRSLPPSANDVLLLHGGGYCWGGIATHREFAARLAHASGRPVTLIDYRRAPEHPYPAAVDDALAAYQTLLERRPDRPISVVGDSAGGGLALALCLRLKGRGIRLPDRLGLVSPWVDLTHSGESLVTQAEADPLISPASLRQCSERYLAGTPADAPEVSPLWGDLGGLPTTLIQVASPEVLLDDARRLAARLEHATLEIEPGLWHVWPLFAFVLPEGRAAIDRLGQFLSPP